MNKICKSGAVETKEYQLGIHQRGNTGLEGFFSSNMTKRDRRGSVCCENALAISRVAIKVECAKSSTTGEPFGKRTSQGGYEDEK